MKASELRKISAEELKAKCVEFKQELFNIRFQLHTGRLENSSRINSIRKQIAQVNTIITEKLV
jgi:large subunit ribosomal protein L29